MRNLTINLPDTNGLVEPTTKEYARLLNVELDSFNRDLNRYVSRIVHTDVISSKTLTANDELVLCNGTFTVTLPTASSSPGKPYYIKNIGTGVITVSPKGTDTIDGESAIVLSSQYDFIVVTSDGSAWYIIADMAMGRDRVWTGDATFTGDVVFTGDSSGLPYGHMYVDGTQSIIVALTLNTPTEVEDDGTTSAEDGWLSGDLNLMTFPTGGTEHYITITKAGVYHITWNLSFKMVAGAANTQIHGGLAVDGTVIKNKCEGHRTISNNVNVGNMGGSCKVDLPNGNEELSLWMENTTNSNDANVVHGSLTAFMVGGT